tara:strand:+ start:1730 stop:2134 length:405 start_codon:yes stop_codon:yes gene_type:complete
MTTSVFFPLLVPTSRSYTPGTYPQQTFEGQNGVKTVLRYGSKRINSTLTLGFSNISDAFAASILENYENVNASWNYVSFTETTVRGIGSTSLQNYMKESGSGLKWRYTSPPSVTSTFNGLSNVSCSFVACLDAP